METKLHYLIPAEKVIKDEISGLYSYIGIFWGVGVPKKLGFYFQSFYIAGKISGIQAGENTSEVQILHPSGSVFQSQILTGTLVPGSVELTAKFDLAKFEDPGKYPIRVIHNGTELPTHDRFYITVSLV